MSSLVFGLTAGFVPWLGRKGKWKSLLPKILRTFDNCVLISAANATYVLEEVLRNELGGQRMFLDSGGYTLFRKQSTLNPEAFGKLCESMKNRFLKFCSKGEYKMIFELDNDYFKIDDNLLSTKNFLREEVKEITGHYPTPVFKMHQGYQYWKDLCESNTYPTLAIGGLAPKRAWHIYRDELTKMMNYARQHGKKVHLLGCQNVETFRLVKPDTVDYCICQYNINFMETRKQYPDLATDTDLFLRTMAMNAFARAKSRSFLYDTVDAQTN